jgi:hypothetical protein
VGEEVALPLRAVFLDAGNTPIGLDYDTIARRIGVEGHRVEAPAVRSAEARARVRLDPTPSTSSGRAGPGPAPSSSTPAAPGWWTTAPRDVDGAVRLIARRREGAEG